ncbi:MAG: hypothetical protein HQK53_07470 [Oligoflexia bacterium]|nr:hypothetical protein [Oligoflexia bacterium]
MILVIDRAEYIGTPECRLSSGPCGRRLSAPFDACNACTPGKARKLLTSGKAKVIGRIPFTINFFISSFPNVSAFYIVRKLKQESTDRKRRAHSSVVFLVPWMNGRGEDKNLKFLIKDK